ncbi:MAG: sigma-70 family RNA polymerase sigma factor [Saprospiraceae bacterium]|nr:sigma-70 family RNA polymerase sigma factor [Saprospiraceae bacterium]
MNLKVPKAKKQNFGLTEADFKNLLSNMQSGDNTLFEEIFLSQFEETVQYISRKYQAEWQDAYDATMDGMLKFHQRLLDGKIAYGNLRFLFTQVAGQMYLDKLRKHKNKDSLEDSFEKSSEEEENIDPEVMEELNKAWDQMCPDCQRVLKAFYYDGISLNDLAEQLEKSPAATRKQKQRCMDKLRDFYLRINNQ